MNAAKKPLPRFWYFPSGFKAVIVMTGDDHGSFYSGSATSSRFADFIAASPSGCSVADWQCVRGTAYLFPQVLASNPLTDSQAASYVAQGFEIGVHVDSDPSHLFELDPGSSRRQLHQSLGIVLLSIPQRACAQNASHALHRVERLRHAASDRTQARHEAGHFLLLLAADLGERRAWHVYRLQACLCASPTGTAISSTCIKRRPR